MPETLKYIDLFAGCGGLSLGLFSAGWHGIFAVEKNQDAFSTLYENLIVNKQHYDWPKWLEQTNQDIYILLKKHREELLKLRGKVPLVVGGPPCQGFSMAGNRDSDDVRNKLFGAYLKFIRLIQPDTLVFENVHGFTVAFQDDIEDDTQAYSEKITLALRQEKYSVCSKLIDVSEYGVPQKRTRFILVASKKFDAGEFFDVLEKNRADFLKRKGIDRTICVADAIGDLLKKNGTIQCPDSKNFFSGVYGQAGSGYQRLMRNDNSAEHPDSHRFVNHKSQTIDLFKAIMAASDISKRYTPKTFIGLKKRGITALKADSICPTVTSIPDDFIHYCEPRIPTVREMARFQSFPDWYVFKGKYTTGGERRKVDVPRYTQVANAVPPLFAEQIGEALKELMCNA